MRNAQMTLILTKEVFVLAKYLDFADGFVEKSANILLKQPK